VSATDVHAARRAALVEGLRGGLVVSCQAPAGSPLRHPEHMAAMARAAELAGAVAIRADGPAFVAAIRAAVKLPIIGIDKRPDIDPVAYITPCLASVTALVAAGADLVAVDGTARPRSAGAAATPAELIAQVRAAHPDLPVMADVAELAEGVSAAAAGADIVATTLSGYTGPPPPPAGPDLVLVEALVASQPRPVIAEGRYATPEEVRAAFAAGAHAVVVGTAITDTLALARRFVAAAGLPH